MRAERRNSGMNRYWRSNKEWCFLCDPCLSYITRTNWTKEDDMETPYGKDCSKALLMYIRIYSLFKSERLSTNIKLMLYKALIRSHLGVCGGRSPLETAAPAKQSSPRYRKPWQAHTGPRNARGFQNSLRVRLHNYIMKDTGRSNPKPCKSNCTWYRTRRSHA
jgi:hypothetical protein